MDHQTQFLVAAVMVLYISLLVLWGMVQGRKVKNEQDYAIAGRKLPGWVAALSERATGESSWALLGLPGAAYATGLAEIWTAIGCVAGIITAWALIAFRLQAAAVRYDINTYSDFLAQKHGESAKMIRMVASFTIVFFFFFYVGAQFLGGGKTLFTLFGIDPRLGMLITAGVIVPYTLYGGFKSVVYTDVVQAIIMITTLTVGPIVGLYYIQHEPGLFADSIGGALTAAGDGYTSLTGISKGFPAGIVIAGGFSWFFGYLGGQPQLSVRFMAIADARQARKARNIGIAWTVIAYLGALSLGWIGLAIFGPNGLSDQEFVMPSVVMRIFPPAIAAILITGAIAAMISTADSLLILSATEFTESLLRPALKSMGYTKGAPLLQSRIVTGSLAVVALLLGMVINQQLIFTLVSYVWAGIGGTFSVVVLLSLFWEKYHGRAVVITIITGMLFTIIWISSGMEEIITTRMLTFIVALITAVLSSWLVKPAEKRQPAQRA
ncbi:MAG: sodium/proline symporter [Bacteroidetes bacterium]|nr:sodium/proline symporter [Bacteroidota bacterium]